MKDVKNMKIEKYRPYPPVNLPNRQWPNKTITEAPQWCSIDLRDGNQALSIPMNLEDKLAMFDLLIDIGFKEIEVGFPSASQVEFDFLRKLIDEKRIPDDVTVQVLTQAREHLVKRTFEALDGVKKAIVHFYNSTSILQRKVVFRKTQAEVKQIAVDAAKLINRLKDEYANDGIRVQYSPESFTGTELDYAIEVCTAVMQEFNCSEENKIILNLPATVEMTTPNIHADQIEYFCNNLPNRKSAIISLHTHNDRGTSVAASELGLLAGADRVEGTLFGNGERTGNLDVITMGLNMFSQGVDPKLDFSDINRIRDIYIKHTRMDVHKRHPYAGELVYTAFSGSHQDAINKGMNFKHEDGIWGVPYLPIDPEDVGRTYESIIRINSQSGKGGVAYIMDVEYGFKLPKAMHPDFGAVVQKITDTLGDELPNAEIKKIFDKEYLNQSKPLQLKKCHIEIDTAENERYTKVLAEIAFNGKKLEIKGSGNGPINAISEALKQDCGINFKLLDYTEHAINHGSESLAVAYICVEITPGNPIYGAGLDSDIGLASVKALFSALNRSLNC